MNQVNHVLRLYDRELLRSAQNYDLQLPQEKIRSVTDLENLFFRVARYLKSSVFIEAGAKDASVSERARHYLPNARLVAFEANPHTFKKYKSNARMKKAKIEYLHTALSNESGSITFSLQSEVEGVKRSKTQGDGSLLTPNLENVKLETHTVKATTLDQFFANETFDDAIMWIDVEGAVDQVLSGGTKLFTDNVGIAFMEVEDREMWKGQWLSHDVHAFMFDKGFTPIARDFQSRYQYNVIYVHERLIHVDYLRYCLAMHASMSAHGTHDRTQKVAHVT